MAQLGVQMFTLRRFTQTPEDLDRALKKVRDIGYKSIQVSAFGNVSPEQTAELCARYDLTIGGTHVPWPRFLEDLDTVISEHELWQCRHTAVGMIPPAEYLSLAGLLRFQDELQPIAQSLNAHGMTFSYHHHAHEFLHFDGKPWIRHLLESIPAAELKMELDTHWVVAGGADPVALIHECGSRMPLLHLKDFVVNHEYKRNFAPIGDGNMNWPAILEAASQYDIDYYFIEQDNCYGEDEFACLERSYDFLARQGLS